jgi:hypothetical protein
MMRKPQGGNGSPKFEVGAAETHGQKLYSLFVKEMPSETLTYTVPGKSS